jgi:hypothetical protein
VYSGIMKNLESLIEVGTSEGTTFNLFQSGLSVILPSLGCSEWVVIIWC